MNAKEHFNIIMELAKLTDTAISRHNQEAMRKINEIRNSENQQDNE